MYVHTCTHRDSCLCDPRTGTATLRAFRLTDRFVATNTALVDANAAAYHAWCAANRWLAARLEALGAISVLATALLVVWGSWAGTVEAGVAGLVLTYALTITRTLSFGVRAATQELCTYIRV